MLGFRTDGRRAKDVPAMFRILPQIVRTRNDAQVYFRKDLPIGALDKYIAKQAKQGVKISYMTAVFAGIVRIFGERPQLNRFIMNGVVYDRNDIEIVFTIKKSMTDDGQEASVKLRFDGDETIFDVKRKLSEAIHYNKDAEAGNDTDALTKILTAIPNWLLRLITSLLIFLDKRGMMPKSIIQASPFHASALFVNIGSVGIDAIYHHIYNFGTIGICLCMGQTKTINGRKCLSLAMVCDERICDGFYFAKSFELLDKYLTHPELLEKPPA
jgi:chloramphenicol O-acetyltransferase